ncbi:hypothetical protein ACWNT8_07135 [Pigmentibacter ruber]
MRIFLYKFPVIFFVIACSKTGGFNNPATNISREMIESSFPKEIIELNKTLDFRYDSVGKGFNSLTGTTSERCFENDSVQFIDAPASNITYEENLSSSQILSKIGIGINLNIPLQVTGGLITLSPEINYARDSSVSELSKTSHLVIEIKKGYNQIFIKDKINSFKMKDNYYKLVKQSLGEFFNTCGDEVIVKQFLKAQLFITAKYTFPDINVKKEFENAMGTSMFNPFIIFAKKEELKESISVPNLNAESKIEPKPRKLTEFLDALKKDYNVLFTEKGSGLSPEIKIKLNKISQKNLEKIFLSIKAIQLGGDPKKLPSFAVSACNLSDLKTCDSIFKLIQIYAANNFLDQLQDEKNLEQQNPEYKFYAGEFEKVLYSSIPIFSNDNININQDIEKYSDNSILFSQLKLNIRNDINDSFSKYLFAQEIKSAKSFNLLAKNEINLVNSTLSLAEKNLFNLMRFVRQCYSDTIKCQNEYSNSKNIFHQNFEKNFDDIHAWQLLASTSANWQPVRYVLGAFNSDRITQDFFVNSIFQGYSLFFFKYLDKDKNKVTVDKLPNVNLSTSFRCHSWLSDALGHIWLQEVYPNTVFPITENMLNICGTKASFSGSINSDLEKLGQFILEIWAH